MSRGYGYVQRFVLAELDERWAVGDEWVGACALAELLDGAPPTRRACRSVRRALGRLASDGAVEITRDGRERVVARVAPARGNEAAERRAGREHARDLRQAARESARVRFEINDQGAHRHAPSIPSVRTRP